MPKRRKELKNMEEYRKTYESGEYNSLEELFKQEHDKISKLHSYFEEKYN